MKICPLALMSGNTYRCNNSCAFSSDGECLVVAALKKYVEEKPAAAVTYPHESGGDSHSDYWREAIFQPPREEKNPW